MIQVYARKCQGCGKVQASKPPNEYKSEAWKDTPCRYCKSTALDYGHDSYTVVNGKIVRIEWTDDLD